MYGSVDTKPSRVEINVSDNPVPILNYFSKNT